MNLSGVCQVQHGPWDVSDGGAGNTANGVTCLDNWLVTQALEPVKWEAIQVGRAPAPCDAEPCASDANGLASGGYGILG